MSQKVPSFTESNWRKLICGKSADRRAKATASELKDPISYSSDRHSPLKVQLSCTVGSERSPPDQTTTTSYKSDKGPSYAAYELELNDLTKEEDERDAFNNERESQMTDLTGFGAKFILEFSAGRPIITEVIGTESGYRLPLSKGHQHGRNIGQK